MSVISNHHEFSPFVSAGKDKNKALTGQRLLKVVFKGRGDKAASMKSVCASVPVVSIDDVKLNVSSFIPYVVELVAKTQDAIGREAVVAGKSYVDSDDLSLEKVIAYLESESKGERLTGDDIKAWFADSLEEMLLIAFADKLSIGNSPTEEQTSTLERMVNVYRDKFASMAGGRTAFDKVTIGKLQKALELADGGADSTLIGTKLASKLQAMANVSVEEMLGL